MLVYVHLPGCVCCPVGRDACWCTYVCQVALWVVMHAGVLPGSCGSRCMLVYVRLPGCVCRDACWCMLCLPGCVCCPVGRHACYVCLAVCCPVGRDACWCTYVCLAVCIALWVVMHAGVRMSAWLCVLPCGS